MAADLYIHVFAEGELTESHFRAFFSNVIGTKWFAPKADTTEEDQRLEAEVGNTASVWVGEVSWLKASIFGDGAKHVPGPVDAVAEVIEEGGDTPLVDDKLIRNIADAMHRPNTTSYRVAEAQDVLAFLNEHRGKRAFTVSW